MAIGICSGVLENQRFTFCVSMRGKTKWNARNRIGGSNAAYIEERLWRVNEPW